MTDLTHTISGLLYTELSENTALDNGTANLATWGYGETREVDIEVWQMVQAATSSKRGFGTQHRMTGTPAAWQAIQEFAAQRADMELTMDGDFDASLGHRLNEQADKIDAALKAVA